MLALCFFSLPVMAQETASGEAEAFFTKAMSQINPKHVAWVKSTAKNANEKNLGEREVRNQALQYGALGSLGNGDIEALVLLVMMQASKSAEEDLKAIMAKVKATNEQKKALRDAMTKLNENRQAVTRVQADSFKLLLQNRPVIQKTNTTTVQPVRTVPRDTIRTGKLLTSEKVTMQEADDLKIKLQTNHDSLSELSEEQQLKMQMVMDRMTKANSAASNMMKKFSDAAASIIQNLK